MGLFSRKPRKTLRDRAEPTFRAASPNNPSTSLANPDAWLLDWAGVNSTFGPPVSERSAMAVSAVYSCVALLAGLKAGTPLKVYQDVPGQGRVEMPDHRLSDRFNSTAMPGGALTSFAWREMWGVNEALWGNHYSVIRRDGAGRAIGFEPAYPWNTEIVPRNGRLAYGVTWADGRREWLDQENVLHFAGLGFDGVRGLSRIQAFARNGVALAKILEETVGHTHENAMAPSAMIELPPGITPAGKRQIEAYYSDVYAGRLNRGKPLYVDKDTKYQQLQMSQEDLNTIEFRRYQTGDICRFFRIPPHLIGEAAGTSAWGTGIEQLTIGFQKYTLEAEFQRIEAELNAKLLANGPYYVRYDRESLLAMDATVAATVAQTEINSGVLTPNERRRQLHRPDVEGGDTPLVNSTMISLDRALTATAPKDSANATPA